MTITYGANLTKSLGAQHYSGTVLMKAYTTHTEKSEVFLSYRHTDQFTAWNLAKELDRRGRRVFIDVHDDTLVPGQRPLDDALLTAISKSDHHDNSCLRSNPSFVVGALGDWCLDASRQTEGHVQSTGQQATAGLSAKATKFREPVRGEPLGTNEQWSSVAWNCPNGNSRNKFEGHLQVGNRSGEITEVG